MGIGQACNSLTFGWKVCHIQASGPKFCKFKPSTHALLNPHGIHLGTIKKFGSLVKSYS